MIKAATITLILSCCALPAFAQNVGLRGVVTYGQINFTANDSFDAILGKPSGMIYTAGGQAVFPHGIYLEVTTGKLQEDGQRVVVDAAGQVTRLGQLLEITLRPIEVTAGWRYRRSDRFVPYGGAGYSRYRYQELSAFAGPGENIDGSFGGFHIVGGGEYLPLGWLGIGGEVVWSRIPDAIGQAGASAAFNEDDLGGTTFRVKLSLGR